MNYPTTIPIVSLKMVKEHVTEYQENINRKDDVIKMVTPIFKNEYREIFVVVGMDTQNKPSIVHIVSYGSINISIVPIANVIKPLLLSNSSSFIILHNHPSDTLYPSSSDKDVTKKLMEAGKLFDITLLDHIILNSDCTDNFSFASALILTKDMK